MKRGFTIVEMLIVISVIGVLMGIVTTAAGNSIRDARDRRRVTMAAVLEQGLATFYQRAGQWPRMLEDRVKSGNFSNENAEWYDLNESEVNACFREIVKCSTDKKDPVLDVTGLFVAPENAKRGMDFNAARKGASKKARKIGVSEMVFGYPDKESGKFKRYGIRYSITGDSVKVTY